MKTNTQNFAAVAALTACCNAVLTGVEHQEDDSTSALSFQPQQEVATESPIASNQSSASTQTARHLVDANHAPGCGQSTGTHHSKYLGCYNDRQDDRAFPIQIPSNGHSSSKCERECTSRRYRYFGRQFKGQCFCGSDYIQIVRHGIDTGCDCCGENVGGGKQCVWENTKRPVTSPVEAPTSQLFANSAYVGSLSFGTSTNLFGEPEKEQEHQNIPTTSAKPPTNPFRLRMYWERGYNWQNSSSPKYWCMECSGNCSSGSKLYIRKCSQTNRQKFVSVDSTIRFAPNKSLCVTASGYGSRNPIRLRQCNGGRNQNFHGVQREGKFELRPSANPNRCISQHHHPKDKEQLYPESCTKTTATKTTYWQVY